MVGSATVPVLEDSRVLQQLLRWVAQNLNIKTEEVVEETKPMIDILSPSGPSHISLPLIKTISETTETLWQTPSLLPPTVKRYEWTYFVPSRGYEHLYTHPLPDSLVVDAANQCERQGYQGPSLKSQEAKKLDLFGRKVYSTGGL